MLFLVLLSSIVSCRVAVAVVLVFSSEWTDRDMQVVVQSGEEFVAEKV
jgi:hypothetical protein